MTTHQDSNWTLFYARSSRDPNRFYKIACYQDRCYCCECPASRIKRQECRHIKAAKAGEVAKAEVRESLPPFRRARTSAGTRDLQDSLDV